MMVMLSALTISGCEKDNHQEQSQHDPVSDDDQTALVEYDGLAFLQSALVVIDENGDIIRRIQGKPLDESQPDVISVPVKDFAMAEELFQEWIAPGKEAHKVNGGFDYNLTDESCKSQGSVQFRALEDKNGTIARMAVAEGTDLKHVSEVKFIQSDLWPENDEVKLYLKYKTYDFEADILKWYKEDGVMQLRVEKKVVPFYCLQSNGGGKSAILVWLCPDSYDSYDHPEPRHYINTGAYKYLPDYYEIQKVYQFYNTYWAEWQAMLVDMEHLGHQWQPRFGVFTTGNSEFLLNRYSALEENITCLDLDGKKSEICWVNKSSWYRYRYMHVRYIPPIG